MKNHVLNAVTPGVPKISPIMPQDRFGRVAAEHRANGFDIVVFPDAGRKIAAPELNPIRQTAHVQSGHALLRNNAARVIFKAGQFDPVGSEKIKQVLL